MCPDSSSARSAAQSSGSQPRVVTYAGTRQGVAPAAESAEMKRGTTTGSVRPPEEGGGGGGGDYAAACLMLTRPLDAMHDLMLWLSLWSKSFEVSHRSASWT
jgi:hypothetical protein